MSDSKVFTGHEAYPERGDANPVDMGGRGLEGVRSANATTPSTHSPQFPSPSPIAPPPAPAKGLYSLTGAILTDDASDYVSASPEPVHSPNSAFNESIANLPPEPPKELYKPQRGEQIPDIHRRWYADFSSLYAYLRATQPKPVETAQAPERQAYDDAMYDSVTNLSKLAIYHNQSLAALSKAHSDLAFQLTATIIAVTLVSAFSLYGLIWGLK